MGVPINVQVSTETDRLLRAWFWQCITTARQLQENDELSIFTACYCLINNYPVHYPHVTTFAGEPKSWLTLFFSTLSSRGAFASAKTRWAALQQTAGFCIGGSLCRRCG
jgi:hypothetical protein